MRSASTIQPVSASPSTRTRSPMSRYHHPNKDTAHDRLGPPRLRAPTGLHASWNCWQDTYGGQPPVRRWGCDRMVLRAWLVLVALYATPARSVSLSDVRGELADD